MLSLLQIILPILAGLLVFLTQGQTAKRLSIIAAVATLGLTLYTISCTPCDGSFNHEISASWLASLGSKFHLGIDGIGLVMLLLSNIVTLLALMSTLKNNYTSSHLFYGLMLIMQGAMNGVFVSLDLVTYYIFWELALIPAYFLVIMWGQKPIQYTGLKFFFYTFIGSLFMLAAIIYLGVKGGSTDIGDVYASTLDGNVQTWVYFAFMLAYAIKIPVFPLHSWQPDTYQKSLSPVTMMLSGIMLKMALYSIIRWVLPVTPNAVVLYSPYIMGLTVFGILYASLIAWRQADLKRVFAYSSMAHVGLIAAGIFTASKAGLDGAMVQMMAHAVTAVGLFYVCQVLSRKNEDLGMINFGGLRHKAPLFAGFYLLVVMASVGLPLTSGFPGEFMLFNAVFNFNNISGILAASGVIIGAIYMLLSYQKVMLGNEVNTDSSMVEVDLSDKLVWIPVAALIILLGFFPSIVTNLSDASVDKVLEIYQSKINIVPTY